MLPPWNIVVNLCGYKHLSVHGAVRTCVGVWWGAGAVFISSSRRRTYRARNLEGCS
jgi:hypothetical protein